MYTCHGTCTPEHTLYRFAISRSSAALATTMGYFQVSQLIDVAFITSRKK